LTKELLAAAVSTYVTRKLSRRSIDEGAAGRRRVDLCEEEAVASIYVTRELLAAAVVSCLTRVSPCIIE
jgi:hypothetical protein